VLLFSLQRCGSLLWRQIQGKAQVEDPNYLFSILDWEPHGKLQYKDLRFLEFWEPVKWLSEQPDLNVAASFKETVLSKYGNLSLLKLTCSIMFHHVPTFSMH
jgi:hypothetical protein